MSDLSLGTIVFYLIATVTVVSAAGVAFMRHIVYSALALLGTFLGVVGLYATLGADFVAVVQLLVYVGGILVITIFAIMLTHRIADVRISNRSVAWFPSLLITGCVFVLLTKAIARTTWNLGDMGKALPTTYGIGNAFLGEYVLPFEIASLVLLAALIGAIVLSRKEVQG